MRPGIKHDIILTKCFKILVRMVLPFSEMYFSYCSWYSFIASLSIAMSEFVCLKPKSSKNCFIYWVAPMICGGCLPPWFDLCGSTDAHTKTDFSPHMELNICWVWTNLSRSKLRFNVITVPPGFIKSAQCNAVPAHPAKYLASRTAAICSAILICSG